MLRFLIACCIAPAATKHVPTVSLIGVGSGKTIRAKPIFMSLDLFAECQSCFAFLMSFDVAFRVCIASM